MQIKQTPVILIFLILPLTVFTQTTYFSQGAREEMTANRLEVLLQKDSVLNFSKNRPYNRKEIIRRISNLYASVVQDSSNAPEYIPARLSEIDLHEMRRALQANPEWTPFTFSSRRPLGRFYRNPSNLYEVNTGDFFLAVNPVFQYIVGKERNNDRHIFLNTRGITLRGRIADRIGFAAYITDNQERDPRYVQQWENERRAVPGAGFYKEFKQDGYDYFDARGYITANIAGFIDISFGHDRNFIGNGHRSLFLSDFSANTLFLKLNTRVWKLNYRNLFMELNTAHRLNADQLFPKKYAALHHLDIAVTRWLNIGLFEGIVFGRNDHFEFGYLNPVIFYRSVEQQGGSFDNALAGVDFRANAAGKLQFYGQLLLDEFLLDELRDNRGWWANKFGYQLGAKYMNVLEIRNLDLQLETNRVRPFTYSHRDSVANYTHYNQPLAHPLGANFHEWTGMLRYQPLPRLALQLRGISYIQGRDTGNISHGSNIFLPNIPPYRTSDHGFDIGAGLRTRVNYLSTLVSYELLPGLFAELNGVVRREKTDLAASGTAIVYFGIRWNTHRRDFEF